MTVPAATARPTVIAARNAGAAAWSTSRATRATLPDLEGTTVGVPSLQPSTGPQAMRLPESPVFRVISSGPSAAYRSGMFP